jgi:hypothetical protein
MNSQSLWLSYSLSNTKFFILLFVLAFISFIYDIQTNICFESHQSPSLYLFLYFHHVVALFLYFGWLSSSKTILLIYAFTVFLIILHWFTNNQKCILTQIVNYNCGLPDNEGFHDIFYFLGMKKQTWFNPFIYTYLVLFLIISLYKFYLLS